MAANREQRTENRESRAENRNAGLVEQVQDAIDYTVNALLESWPEAVHAALQQGDQQALAAALASLPAEQASEIMRLLEMLSQ